MVICTRGPREGLARAVRSALGDGDDGPREVIVVDQGTDAAAALAGLDDDRVRLVPGRGAGLARGRNQGIRAASCGLVALTDDDCEAPPGWAAAMASALELAPDVGVVFGDVRAGPHDAVTRFVPAYAAGGLVVARGRAGRARVQGMGACMGVRRTAWEAAGGFDEMLGAGAPFRAAEEGDLAARALRAGYAVVETPAVAVVHHGARSRADAAALADGYWFGTGAMLAKHARLRDPSLVGLVPRLAWRWIAGGSRVAASLGPAAPRSRRLHAFARGVLAGARAPLDRRAGRFRAPGPP